jgi:hypothetical protein
MADDDLASAELLLFDLPSGLHGFWPGHGPLPVDGVSYVGAGSLIKIEPSVQGLDFAATPLRVTLRAVPDSELSPDKLATIEDEQYKGRPSSYSLAYFERATGALITVERLWQGYIDFLSHEGTVAADYVLVGNLEPRSLDHSRRGFRVRGDADQKLIDPDDKFYEHAATVTKENLPYGRASSATGATTLKSAGAK